MSHALTEVSQRKLHVRESVRLLVGAVEHSFLEWSRRERIRRRKKMCKAEMLKSVLIYLEGS